MKASPKGWVPHQIRLVPGVRARFEWIDLKSRTWKVDHTCEVPGKALVQRRACQKIGNILNSWCDVLAKDPLMKDDGWLVWSQPNATMDGVICAWQADLMKEESDHKPVVHVVDLFALEPTEDNHF